MEIITPQADGQSPANTFQFGSQLCCQCIVFFLAPAASLIQFSTQGVDFVLGLWLLPRLEQLRAPSLPLAAQPAMPALG